MAAPVGRFAAATEYLDGKVNERRASGATLVDIEDRDYWTGVVAVSTRAAVNVAPVLS
jgi:hypothetical protein